CGTRGRRSESRLAGLALRPEPRPKARRPPTRAGARGDEPRRTEFDLQGQYSLWHCPSELKSTARADLEGAGRRAERGRCNATRPALELVAAAAEADVRLKSPVL